MLFIKTKDIEEKMELSKSQAGRMFRKYKKLIKEEGYELIDQHTLPTKVFVELLSKDTGVDSEELCKRFEV